MNIPISQSVQPAGWRTFVASLSQTELAALLALVIITAGQVLGVVYLCSVHQPPLWEWEVPWFSILEYLKRNWGKLGAAEVWITVAGLSVAAQAVLFGYLNRKVLLFALKSLGRNPLRTGLTSLAVMVLVFVITLIWTVLVFLDLVTQQKSKEFKAIVTEKFQIPSQMPYAYAEALRAEAMALPEGLRPSEDDLMTWQFFGGTLDPEKRTRENMLFFFALEPRKLRTMMDDLENLDPELIKKLEAKRNGCILGQDRLKATNKQVGETFKVTSMNYKGIDLEFEIVGLFPEGRYDNSAAMNRDYLLAALDDYKNKNKGVAHPMANKTLNLFWMRLPSEPAYDRMGERVASPGRFASPATKFEMASSAIGSWLDGYKDIVWAMRWLLSPAILLIMSVVVANAISISVRERRTEMAVLKVLGFGPARIIAMILAEALLIGCASGLLSAGLSYLIVTVIMKGIKFPVAFFPVFNVYLDALWWGLLIGAGTALLGSILPAWSARRVRVAEVFAKIA